ncbi:MAG: hypothetical protein ACO2O2_00795 [Acidilobaceae archaeon]
MVAMSSEHFEERGGEEEEVELLRREGVGEESLVEAPEEGAVEAEEPRILYDVTKPELLETMIIASDILTQASLGQISLGEARRLYEREVVARIRKLVAGGVVVKKKAKARRAERKTEKKKKAKTEVKKEKKAKKEAKEGKKARGKRKEGGGVEGEG